MIQMMWFHHTHRPMPQTGELLLNVWTEEAVEALISTQCWVNMCSEKYSAAQMWSAVLHARAVCIDQM